MTTHPIDQASEDQDGDLLDSLGFAPADAEDQPLLAWARTAGWPAVRRRPRGRHRVLRSRVA